MDLSICFVFAFRIFFLLFSSLKIIRISIEENIIIQYSFQNTRILYKMRCVINIEYCCEQSDMVDAGCDLP